MSLVEEKINATNTSRYYKTDNFRTKEEAIRWLSGVRKLNGLITNYFYFYDLTNRIDEESDSIQLDANASLDDMEKNIKNKSIDAIVLNGKFNEKPVVIGVDLQESMIYITVRNKTQPNIEDLEELLGLV